MVEPPGPVLVVVPTYDERENLGPAVARLHAALPDADVLVVDDASPDGTFRVIAGRDRDGNGVYGEVSEPRRERQAILGPDATTADVGELTPQ